MHGWFKNENAAWPCTQMRRELEADILFPLSLMPNIDVWPMQLFTWALAQTAFVAVVRNFTCQDTSMQTNLAPLLGTIPRDNTSWLVSYTVNQLKSQIPGSAAVA